MPDRWHAALRLLLFDGSALCYGHSVTGVWVLGCGQASTCRQKERPQTCARDAARMPTLLQEVTSRRTANATPARLGPTAARASPVRRASTRLRQATATAQTVGRVLTMIKREVTPTTHAWNAELARPPLPAAMLRETAWLPKGAAQVDVYDFTFVCKAGRVGALQMPTPACIHRDDFSR